MEEWIDRLASSLAQEPVSPQEMGAVLKLARDVAHGVERKLAPVSTYLVGVYVGTRSRHGVTRGEALRSAVRTASQLILEPTERGEAEQSTGSSPRASSPE